MNPLDQNQNNIPEQKSPVDDSKTYSNTGVQFTPIVGSLINQQTSVSDKFSPRKLAIFSGLFVATLLILFGLVAFKIYRGANNSENQLSTSSNSKKQTSSTAPRKSSIANKLNADELKTLNTLKYAFYAPSNSSFSYPYLSVNMDHTELTTLEYSINPDDQHIPNGSYTTFKVFPKTTAFKPPTDCGLYNGATIPDVIPCIKYSGSDIALPAYVFSGYPPPHIDHVTKTGEGVLPVSLYADYGEMIVVVQRDGAQASDLYSLAKQVKQIKASDLPYTTRVNFYHQLN